MNIMSEYEILSEQHAVHLNSTFLTHGVTDQPPELVVL